MPVELGAYRQRALLGLLLANAGTVLSTDRILDELWGETAGTDKQGSLWVYVSGLRGALEPGRTKRSEGAILLTRAPGYVLAVDRDDTDVGRFERAIAEARLLIETDPGRRRTRWRPGWRCGVVTPTRSSPTNPGRRRRSPASRSSVWRPSRTGSTPTSGPGWPASWCRSCTASFASTRYGSGCSPR